MVETSNWYNYYNNKEQNTSQNQDTSAFNTDKDEGKVQDTSAFNTDKKQLSEQDTSLFDTKGNNFGQVQDTSIFDTQKSIKKDKGFIYLNLEGLPFHRKNKRKGRNIIKKYLKNKYKVISNIKEEKSKIILDFKDNTDKIKINKLKKDLKEKEKILEKDKNHNLHIKTLKEQGKTKNQILSILNQENKPKFIKYEKNYETIGLNRKVAQTAIALVEKKDNLGALHCTDWVNRIYKKVAHERVYDSHTIFNGVKHISKGTGIGAEQYASKSLISSIKPGEHIMVDFPVHGEYNNGKTHSVIALSKPKDGLLKVASYPNYGAEPIIEMYDLYGLDRAKSAKPIRIQSA